MELRLLLLTFLVFAMGALAAVPAGFRETDHILRFDDPSSYRIHFYEGDGKAETATGKTVVTLHCKAAALFPVQRMRPILERPLSAVFHVELLQGKAELRFLIADRDGKEFRAEWQTLSPGANQVSFPLEKLLTQAKKPARLTGISLRSAEASAVVALEAVKCSDLSPVINVLNVSLHTGYPINIENPESDRKAEIVIANPTNDFIRTQFKLTMRDEGDEDEKRQAELTFAPGETHRIALAPARKRGIRYGTLELYSPEAPGEIRKEEFSIAVMIPASPSPERAKGFLFGVCSHPQRHPVKDQIREAAAAALCGAKVLREDAMWGMIQPRAGVWDFTSLDRTVEIFEKQGLELELIYSYTPKWAIAKEFKPLREERRRTHNSRPDYSAWREFVRRTAERYRGRIRFFEVWNEPDLLSFANFSTEEYIEMLKIASEETRKANPEALLLTGGYTCMPPFFALNDQKHQEKTLSLTKGLYDIHAFHGHGPFFHYYPQIERMLVMREQLGVTAPWWANETAETSVFTGETGQAETLWRKLFYSWANGSIGYNWYDLRNDGFDPRDVEQNFGMVRHDFNPKAIYPAYNTITRHFGKAEYTGSFGGIPQLRLYRFRDGNDILLTGWNDSPDSARRLFMFKTDAGSAETVDLYDNCRKLELSQGYFLGCVTETPSAFRLSGARKVEMLSELLTVEGAVTLPHAVTNLNFKLTNPLPEPESFELSFTLPEAMMLKEPVRPVRLKPGETRSVTVGLLCEKTTEPDVRLEAHLRIPRRNLSGTATFPVRPTLRLAKQFGARPDFILNHPKQLITLAPADPGKAHLFWKGPEDLSAELFLALDKETLKLKVVVTDDIHYQPFRDGRVWEADNIQIGLQIPGQRKPWEIGLTHLGDNTPQCWIWAAPEGFDPTRCAAAIRLETTRLETEKKTVYEAEFPLKTFGAGAQEIQQMIRFNLLVNDNDGEMRESYLRLAPGLGTDRNPAAWYLLVSGI